MLLFALPARVTFGQSDAIHLTIGDSKLLRVGSADKIAIGNPAVVDVTTVSNDEVLLSAKSVGSTSLTFLSADGRQVGQTVIVTAHNLKKAMIEIGVEIMEIQSQSALEAGLSWGSIAPATSSSTASPVVSNSLVVSENAFPPLLSFGSLNRQAITASLQLLINRGKAKVLAKPKLLAVSGEEASFLAGGEVPYIVQNSLGASSVEFKPYGVKLNIKPTLDADGNIAASLRAEVSGIDSQNGISLNNAVIPALRTRWVETNVYMRGGSTMVIAGLIEDESQKLTSGIPVLSDIPVLGELFKFTDNRQTQTELVIFVTPSLVGQNDDTNG
ncbi:MAG TPA: pilus assembly protein N-terminal domain-containing protein [bacterium]|nr:pilus assembly protein N-terminal domain-containing protein [bacterium]